jgi:hypothetical protein
MKPFEVISSSLFDVLQGSECCMLLHLTVVLGHNKPEEYMQIIVTYCISLKTDAKLKVDAHHIV